MLSTQLTLPQSVTKRYWHSVSSFNVTSDIVWVIVFGGNRSTIEQFISDTSVVELSKHFNILLMYLILIVHDDGEWQLGDVMTHPLSDYEQKLIKRRQSHQPSFQEMQQLYRQLLESKEQLQQERQEKQRIQETFQQEIRQLHQEKLIFQQSQERELEVLQRERILLNQLQEVQQGKTGFVQELHNESSWIISREEIHMTEQILGRGGWGEVKIVVLF